LKTRLDKFGHIRSRSEVIYKES